MFKFSGKRPNDLGVTAGKLKAASKKPNSVCSQSDSGYAKIEPLNCHGDAAGTWEKLKALVEQEASIIKSSDDYLYAEYTSPLMGYVDDVEFLLLADEGVVHLRSASRLGYSDMNANRKRIESLRSRLA
jgi:uncharacterized protein (DUF1499 family)